MGFFCSFDIDFDMKAEKTSARQSVVEAEMQGDRGPVWSIGKFQMKSHS